MLRSIGGAMANQNHARKMRLQRYAGCYFPFKPPGHWRDGACCYCGNPAQNRDHVPPLVWVESLGQSWFYEASIPLVWVPSCAECNILLGAERLFTIAERTAWLLRKYETRYQQLLSSPRWTQGEINELTGRTKKAIERWAQIRLNLGRRLVILSENERVRAMREELQTD